MRFSGNLLCLAMLAIFLGSIPAMGQVNADDLVRQHFEAAKQAETSGDLDKAVAEYQAVLKARPDLAEVRTNLGLVLYRQGKNEGAINAFEKALQTKPELLGATLFLGMAYVRTNQYEKALDPLNKAIALSPKETKAY